MAERSVERGLPGLSDDFRAQYLLRAHATRRGLSALWHCMHVHGQRVRQVRPDYRPRCKGTRKDGTPCQAPVLWDRTRNAPASDRCFRHGVAGWPTTRRVATDVYHDGIVLRMRGREEAIGDPLEGGDDGADAGDEFG